MRPSNLILRTMVLEDEREARQAHRELATERFPFLLGAQEGEAWSTHLERTEQIRAGVDLPDGLVPATFFVAEIEGRIVGRVSVRHHLNGPLAETGGHIGYAVRPGDRGRGVAGEILRRSIIYARTLGIDHALLVCDGHNVASRHVIESNGGRFERLATSASNSPRRRYWIAT